jgi:hypothetical protein
LYSVSKVNKFYAHTEGNDIQVYRMNETYGRITTYLTLKGHKAAVNAL